MELDERKKIILKHIIKSYLDTGEPVGSRTISKFSGLNISPATIRNEMSDLEEMGYLMQPHPSAGRIPTDEGYRFYVNCIREESKTQVKEVSSLMIERVDKLEMLLKHLVKTLALDTDYAALISGPTINKNKIKYVQLSLPREGKLLMTLVLDGNVIKNELMDISESLDFETVRNIDLMINNHLSGLSLEEISPKLVTDMMVQAGEHGQTIKGIIDTVVELIETDSEGGEVFTSGAKNIFKYPELADVERATELITAFEEKEDLKKLVKEVADIEEVECDSDFGAVQVYFGGEGPVKNMQNCSLVTAHYELADGMRGVIGVIGPKRMDYEKVMSSMKNMKEQLDRAFRDF
ncbi:MAG: heat-inducible transcriptional repressor HrcA [Eubacteriales bacterium]|nr:heat-inducible transcriptional repressor HrcA [Eubacteriales bacterium]